MAEHELNFREGNTQPPAPSPSITARLKHHGRENAIPSASRLHLLMSRVGSSSNGSLHHPGSSHSARCSRKFRDTELVQGFIIRSESGTTSHKTRPIPDKSEKIWSISPIPWGAIGFRGKAVCEMQLSSSINLKVITAASEYTRLSPANPISNCQVAVQVDCQHMRSVPSEALKADL